MAILLHALVSNVIDVSSEMYEGEQKYGVLNSMLKMELYKGNTVAVDQMQQMMFKIRYAIDNVLS